MLGTNDAKTFQWNQTEYVNDSIEMAESFIDLPSKPEVYLMIPPPLYVDGFLEMNQTVINHMFPQIIPDIAKSEELKDADVKVIDVFNMMGGVGLTHYEHFCDGQNCDACHPNDAGYTALASGIYKYLFNPVPMPDPSQYAIKYLDDPSFI